MGTLRTGHTRPCPLNGETFRSPTTDSPSVYVAWLNHASDSQTRLTHIHGSLRTNDRAVLIVVMSIHERWMTIGTLLNDELI